MDNLDNTYISMSISSPFSDMVLIDVHTPLTGLVFILTSITPYCISKAMSRVAATPGAVAFPLELSFGCIILSFKIPSSIWYALLEPERLTMSTSVDVGAQSAASSTTVLVKFSVYERQVGLGFMGAGFIGPYEGVLDEENALK